MARLAATVTEETVERLRALAAQYGFIARAGRYIGEPSISELLDAIGDGRGSRWCPARRKWPS
jgi:hypothetical protein